MNELYLASDMLSFSTLLAMANVQCFYNIKAVTTL